ncbi:Uncharacterised protein [Legionella feeleii]|uniref:Uncharacterized protein n=1 Tax=Legionella feeleii TaxID=453 RepID=A0A2X1SYH3_9GAMM|nr:Uncharacterised protein [Legionella feeleii]
MAAIVTVYAVKTAILKYNESTMRDRLQTGLKTLEETHEEKAEVEAGNDLDMSPHHEISTGLTQVLTHTVDSTLTTVTVSRSDNNEEPSKLHVSGGASFFNHEHGHHETTTPASDVKSKRMERFHPLLFPPLINRFLLKSLLPWRIVSSRRYGAGILLSDVQAAGSKALQTTLLRGDFINFLSFYAGQWL